MTVNAIKTVCVFCGSSTGHREVYREAAIRLADTLIERGIGLVYGGGNIGLMGITADRMLKAGCPVTGVLPEFMDGHVGHLSYSAYYPVKTMSERKEKMRELSDAFLAMPGGFGTWEELLEVSTLTQLGVQDKACGLLNTDHYYDALIQQFLHAVREGFVKEAHQRMLIIESDPACLLDRLAAYVPVRISKWKLDDEAD